jgi:hypothetical protein
VAFHLLATVRIARPGNSGSAAFSDDFPREFHSAARFITREQRHRDAG